jgi:hypothetical protein
VIRAAVAVVLLSVTGAACAGGQDCNTIGGVSRVYVDVVALGQQVSGSTVCVDGACTDSLGSGQALAALPSDDPASYQVTVAVKGADGHELAHGAGRFSTSELRPNGEGCDPVLQQINLVMGADGTLTPR